MCQSQRALVVLSQKEMSGALVINAPRAIRNCYRAEMTRLLVEAGIPTPRSFVVPTNQRPRLDGLSRSGGVFVKRGDFHALSVHDVVRVEHPIELEREVARFASRGVVSVVLQEAIIGEVVKFYGVSGGKYFSCPNNPNVDQDVLERIAQIAGRAADALGLEVWGGDAALSKDGPVIVDFNDWPSFSAVRSAAAKEIANRAVDLVNRAAHSKGVDTSDR